MDRPIKPYEVRQVSMNGRSHAGCFATRALVPGEHLARFTGPKFSGDEMLARIAQGIERTGDDPFEIAVNAYIDIDPPYLFFNHSCEPNAVLAGESDLVVFRPISAGEEIRFDYATNVSGLNPWVMGFKCACGSPRCRRTIGNVLSIPMADLRKYYEFGALQDYIRAELAPLMEANAAGAGARGARSGSRRVSALRQGLASVRSAAWLWCAPLVLAPLAFTGLTADGEMARTAHALAVNLTFCAALGWFWVHRRPRLVGNSVTLTSEPALLISMAAFLAAAVFNLRVLGQVLGGAAPEAGQGLLPAPVLTLVGLAPLMAMTWGIIKERTMWLTAATLAGVLAAGPGASTPVAGALIAMGAWAAAAALRSNRLTEQLSLQLLALWALSGLAIGLDPAPGGITAAVWQISPAALVATLIHSGRMPHLAPQDLVPLRSLRTGIAAGLGLMVAAILAAGLALVELRGPPGPGRVLLIAALGWFGCDGVARAISALVTGLGRYARMPALARDLQHGVVQLAHLQSKDGHEAKTGIHELDELAARHAVHAVAMRRLLDTVIDQAKSWAVSRTGRILKPEILRTLRRAGASEGESAALTARLDDLISLGERTEIKRTAVDLSELVAEAIQTALQHPDHPAPLCVVRELQPGLVMEADRQRLLRALVNIVTNASAALGGRGTLTARSLPRTLCGLPAVGVEIGNDGPAIAAEHLGHVFEAFYSTDPAGGGLGLTIVRETVNIHGGTIHCESTAERGTWFTLTFPAIIAKAAPGAGRPAEAAAIAEHLSAPVPGSQKTPTVPLAAQPSQANATETPVKTRPDRPVAGANWARH